MKVSELLTKIITTAEDKFGVDRVDNGNDCISVWIFSDGDGDWQVGLQRPTQRNLDHGEITVPSTSRLCENRVGFYTVDDDLMYALYKLLDQVEAADEFDFNP